MTTPDHDAAAKALGGMLAAVEYLRVQFASMATRSSAPEPMLARLAEDQAALYAIEEDCKRGDLDLTGAMAAVTLRAASLAASVVDGMTVPKFLDLLEAETHGWKAPGY
jgi:hypothetical protein